MGKVLSCMRLGGTYEVVEDLEKSIQETKSRAEKQKERNSLETDFQQKFKAIISIFPPTQESLEQFDQLLQDHQLNRFEELLEEMKFWDASDTIPEPKSFLYCARLQPVMVQMLEDIVQYREYLERFIIRLQAENEVLTVMGSVHNPELDSEPTTELGAPIHYAVLQLNGEFLDFLLARSNIDVNLRDNYKRTALTLLCEKYDQCMRKSVPDMPSHIPAPLATIRTLIRKLLQAGADFNICSMLVKLPFELLLKHCGHDETRSFVDECVQLVSGALAVRSLNDRKKRVVGFYNKKYPVKVTVELLEIFLRYRDLTNFVTHMKDFNVNETNVKRVIRLLLHTACDQNLSDCARLILVRGGRLIFKVVQSTCKQHAAYVTNEPTDLGLSSVVEDPDDAPNKSTDPGLRVAFQDPHASELEDTEVQNGAELEHRVELKGLLKKICLMANLSLLRRFLAKISDPILLNDDSLLLLTLEKAHDAKSRTEERNALLACAELLATQEMIHMSKKNNSGNTSLHLALKYGFESVALVILRHKVTCLRTCNNNNLTPLDYGTYEFWKKYLDQCVELDLKRSIPNCDEIRFNLNGFCSQSKYEDIPVVPKPTVNADGIMPPSCWKMIRPIDDTFTLPQRSTTTVTEMTSLQHIAQSKVLKHLLVHPVLYTFIMVKWARVCHWNYLNLLLTILSIVSFTSYSLTACSAEGPSTVWFLLGILGAVFVLMRELLQFLFLRRSYLSLVDVCDIAIAIAMVVVLSIGCHGLMSSFVIISLAMQLSFMIGSLQSNNIATMMYMFKTVSINFLKSFALFSPLILAFIFAFHLSYNQSPVKQEQVCHKADCAQDNFNNFRTFWNATVKTLVMTTGEFEAAAIDFEGGKMLLFIVFMFFAPIVILNLINGLAVSDIAAIREESELISISKKVMLLEQYERGVANVRPAWLKRCFPRPFFFEYESHIRVITEKYNKIVVHTKVKSKHQFQSSSVSDKVRRRFTRASMGKALSKFPWLLNSKSCNYIIDVRFFRLALFVNLDQSIVNEALKIIEKQNENVSFVPSKGTPFPEVRRKTVAGSGRRQRFVHPGPSRKQHIDELSTHSEDYETE